jgi:signal transduction histidine kinase/DNA-binding NarL/FixJ family response regulator
MPEELVKLLLVEDIDSDAGLVRPALSDVDPKNFAFSLVHATGFVEATRYLQESTFHVVILNLSTNDSRGLDSVAPVKKVAPTIPILIVTGLSDERVAIEAMRSGAQDYLMEGEVDGSALVRAIRYAIERKKIETQIQQLRDREALLREINVALTSTLDVNSVLDILLGRIVKLRPEFSVTIRLKSNKTGAFDPVACRNLDTEDWKTSPSIVGGTGLTQVVVTARKPVLIPDVQNDPRTENREFMMRHGLVAFLGIPLIVKGDVLGVLGFWTKTKHEFSPEEVEFFSTLGSQAAAAISNSLLYEEARRANERQSALREFNLTINASLDLRSVLERLLEKVATFGSGYACTIRLVNEETRSLEAVASRHVDEKDWRKNTATLREGLTQAVALARAPLTVLDLARDKRVRRQDYIRHNAFVSYLGLPLLVQDEFVGVLSIYTKKPHEFSPEETEFLSTLAEQAATAIHNSRLYEKLKTAHAALEKAVEVKSVLMGVMAHELKSPIQVIMGAASLLSQGMFGEITEDQRVRIQSIESGANELVELIDSALEMTRLEQGKMALVATEISVEALLAELKAEFSEAFNEKGIELDIKMPPPGFLMITDRLKLKEILRNLLDNARKFTAQGKVTVEFESKGDDRVEFIVTDTGIGIPPEYSRKIFDLFYQVDLSQKEHASAGMGLNIVKRLVEAMDGEISVTSDAGQGSTFRVELARAIASAYPD